MVSFQVGQVPEATERLGFDERVTQLARDREALLEQASGLPGLVAAQVQLTEGSQGHRFD